MMDFFKRGMDYGFFLLVLSLMYWITGSTPTFESVLSGGIFLVILNAIGALITHLAKKEEY